MIIAIPPMLWRTVSGVRFLRVDSGPSRTISATRPTTMTVVTASPANTGPRPTSANSMASGVEAISTDTVPGIAWIAAAAVVKFLRSTQPSRKT